MGLSEQPGPAGAAALPEEARAAVFAGILRDRLGLSQSERPGSVTRLYEPDRRMASHGSSLAPRLFDAGDVVPVATPSGGVCWSPAGTRA